MKRAYQHLDFLCDVGEMLAALAGSADMNEFLNHAVELVSQHLHTAVCSIYLLDTDEDELELRATVGLNREAVGSVRLRVGEGLVGKALKELRPICEAHASSNPDYRYFPQANEEAFDSFLAVPIQRGVEKTGVLVVQRPAGEEFSLDEIAALRALASQLAGAVESTRALLSLREPPVVREAAAMPPLLKGTGVGEGYALAPARVFRRHSLRMHAGMADAADCRTVDAETAAAERALAETAQQLEALQKAFESRLPEVVALIFDAHLLMLKDSGFRERICNAIADGCSARKAVALSALQYVDLFEASTHDYMKEKAADVEDLALRILANLAGDESVRDAEPHIVVAQDLLPSDVLKFALGGVRGIVLTSGGVTSHVAILARSLGIPAVLVRGPELMELADGVPLLVDAAIGNLYIHPGEEVRRRFSERKTVEQLVADKRAQMREDTSTADGVQIHLMANINLLSELELALELKAEGVGLYRTEFPFLIRPSLPSEAEQEVIYRHLFDKMAGREITVRTLDAGGDKMLSYFDHAGEANPELGLRSTRFTLRHREVFDQQLGAILRAAAGTGNVRVMFPMIASIDEFREARSCLAQARARLVAAGVAVPQTIATGMMIELPAVVELMDVLLKEADFFSIGTNDFIQYMLAADRTNEKVAEFYQPHHPAVLRALARVVESIAAAGGDVSVCGEMAHDPRYVKYFVGLGIRKLSVDPVFLPALQESISGFTVEEAQTFSRRLRACGSLQDVEAVLAETGTVAKRHE